MPGIGTLKSVTLTLICICISFGLVSCMGISQAEFDLISKDLDATRANEQRVSNELSIAQSKIKDIQTELEGARSKLSDARSNEKQIANDLAVALGEINYIQMELDNNLGQTEQAQIALTGLTELLTMGVTEDTSLIPLWFAQIGDIENQTILDIIEYLFENADSLSDEESGMLILYWLEEIEKMLN